MIEQEQNDYTDVDERIERLFANIDELSIRYLSSSKLSRNSLTVQELNTIHKTLCVFRWMNMGRQVPEDEQLLQTIKDCGWLRAMMFAHNTEIITRDTPIDFSR